MTDRLRRKWARAKLGRDIVTQSSAISQSLTNPQTPNPETTNDVTTNDVTTNAVTTNEVTTNGVTTNQVTTDAVTSSEPTTSPGRIATLNFSPILKFDNPISKYIGRNFRDKNAPPSVRKILATTTGPILPKKGKIPKRFLRGQMGVGTPPTMLKMARNSNSPMPPVSLAANQNSVHSRHVTLGPLTPTIAPTSPSLKSILDEYPPSKVLFHEKNSTRKFTIKFWDSVPFQGDREIPKGMKINV